MHPEKSKKRSGSGEMKVTVSWYVKETDSDEVRDFQTKREAKEYIDAMGLMRFPYLAIWNDKHYEYLT